MGRQHQIDIVLHESRPAPHHILQGITAYSKEHGPWHFCVRFLDNIGNIQIITQTQADGVLAAVGSMQAEKALIRSGIPIVLMYVNSRTGRLPSVVPDEVRIGQLAAEHLLQSGFKNFAYSGVNDEWSTLREAGFSTAIRAAGRTCLAPSPYVASEQPNWKEPKASKLAKWLKNLPKPVAIMACHDTRGIRTIELCSELNLQIPDQVAIVGVNNEAEFCELAPVPLSSVMRNSKQLGYTAAGLLEKLIDGDKPPTQPVKVPPLGVMVRRSSDAMVFTNPDVTTAVRYIRDNACKGISVNDVAAHAQISRRTLERLFFEEFGRSPGDQIRLMRLESARTMLLVTTLPVVEIAKRCGFGSLSYLSQAFSVAFGQNPSRFRELLSIQEALGATRSR